jgi:hypothetical protein
MIEPMATTKSPETSTEPATATKPTPAPTRPTEQAPARPLPGSVTVPTGVSPLDVPFEDLERDEHGAVLPVPGDPRTEPVATASQSWVAGRVGPATIAQDANAPHLVHEGLDQVLPGQEVAPNPGEPTGGTVPVVLADPQGELLAAIATEQGSKS